jgi:O-antigen ligase
MPWGVAIIEVLAFVALVFAVLALKVDRGLENESPDSSWASSVAVPVIALGSIALLGVVQSAVWPPELVQLISPAHRSIQEQAAELLASMGLSGASTLSLAPSESRVSALIWAAAASCFAAAALAGTRHYRRLLAATLVGSALFQVVYGAANWGTSFIWGTEVGGTPDRLRGTFVNPDHMAMYLEITLATVFAWGWWAVHRARKEPNVERGALWIVPPVLVWLALFTGLAFSGSRGGLLAAIVSVGAQGLLIAWLARRWRVGLIGAGAALAGFLAVTAIGLQQGLGRWLATSAHDLTWNERLMGYKAAMDLWRQFPWTGTGLGSFQEAFSLVEPAEFNLMWTHAHSDVLELPVTTGVVGLILLLPGLVFLVARLALVLRTGKRSEDRAAALAAFGALAALALHSCFDFGLTIPANAATLAIVCGAAAGVRLTSTASDQSEGAEPFRALPFRSKTRPR